MASRQSWWARLSLRPKIVVPIFVMTTIAIVGLASGITYQFGFVQDRLTRDAEGKTIATDVRAELRSAKTDDPASLAVYLRQVSIAYPDVAAICVLTANLADPTGPLVVYASNRPPASCDPGSPLIGGIGTRGDRSMIRQTAAGQLDETAVTVLIPSTGRSTVVEVLLNFTPSSQLLQVIFVDALLTGMGLVIFQTGLVHLLLWFAALRPLKRLRLAALAATQAARPAMYQDSGTDSEGDEIQQLSLRFAQMLAAVELREQEIIASHVELESVIANAPVIVFSATADGRMLQLGGTGTDGIVERLGHAKLEEVTLLEIAGANANLADLIARARSGESIHEIVSIRPEIEGSGAEAVHLDLIINPTFDDVGMFTGLSGLAVNITDRVGAASARAASKQKSAFLAAMSHELRTPLESVMSLSQLLDQPRARVAMSAKQVRYVNHIRSAGSHLLALVSDILDVAKVGSGQLVPELETVSLAELILDPVDQTRASAAEKGLAIDVVLAPGLVAHTDPVRVRQMLSNLLSNAVRFTPRDGGKILVSARAVRGGVEISVADSGIGIGAADQEKIFDEFIQVDRGSTRRLDGTGLGLTLTRLLAALVGGRIRVESVLGAGSKFTIWLPAAAGSGQARPAERAAPINAAVSPA
jgi:signal transduction histidine kinase